MDDLYKSFETWWSSDKSQFTEDDELKQFAWSIWQASRAAVEVELPKQVGYDDPLSAHLAIGDCSEAIRAAGIRVKGDV